MANLSALAQLIALYGRYESVTKTADLATLTGYSSRAIRKAKAELQCHCGTIVPPSGTRVPGGTIVPLRNHSSGTPVPPGTIVPPKTSPARYAHDARATKDISLPKEEKKERPTDRLDWYEVRDSFESDRVFTECLNDDLQAKSAISNYTRQIAERFWSVNEVDYQGDSYRFYRAIFEMLMNLHALTSENAVHEGCQDYLGKSPKEVKSKPGDLLSQLSGFIKRAHGNSRLSKPKSSIGRSTGPDQAYLDEMDQQWREAATV